MSLPTNPPEFDPGTVKRILHINSLDGPHGYGRTPLHIDFDPTKNDVEPDQEPAQIRDPKSFNAVGSVVLQHYGDYPDDPEGYIHRPVLDIDRPVFMEHKFGFSRVSVEVGSSRKAMYRADSWLRPILRELGIELEVFPSRRLEGGGWGTSVSKAYVNTVTLTCREVNQRMYLSPSTTDGHGHLYINGYFGFRWDAYQELLHGLSGVGVIDPDWVDQSIRQGMTIVRTPWTKVPAQRKRS